MTLERGLTERLRVIRLFEVYGALLTDRQQALLRLYYHDDFSLSEIAERLAVTRQAIFDALRRAIEGLERLEASLQVVASRRQLLDRLDALDAALRRLAGRLGRNAVEELEQQLDAVRRSAP